MEKREKVLRSYDHYKRQITHWETAILKNTGRKPNRDDLFTAPEIVQKAYKEYKKIKKYLESRPVNEEQSKPLNIKAVTPKKIFFTYRARSSTAIETSLPDTTNEIYKKLSSKLYMASSLSNCESTRSSDNSQTNKDSSSFECSSSGTINHVELAASTREAGEDCVDSCSLSKDHEGGIQSKTCSSISALWQNPTVGLGNNELPLVRNHVENIRKVNTRWLERCDADINVDSSESAVGKEPFNSPTIETPFVSSPKAIDASSDSIKLHSNFEDYNSTTEFMNMNIDCSGDFILNINEVRDVLAEEGISVNFDDLHKQQINNDGPSWSLSGSCSEVLPPQSPTNDTKSLDQSHAENVCENEMNDDASSVAPRKRPLTVAFSPSPEKPQPKRKFFKSSRAERESRRVIPKPKPLTETLLSSNCKQPPPKVTKVLGASDNCDAKIISSADSNTNSNTNQTLVTSEITANSKISCKRKSVINCTNKVDTRSKAVNTKKAVELEKCSDTNSKQSIKENDVMYDEVVQINDARSQKKFKPSKMSKKQLLERKVTDGKVNNNFVRIDLRKKVFVRGHKKISGAKVKRMNWKSKQSAAFKSSTLICRKCGESGHFAKFCMKDMISANDKQEPDQIDDSPFPTLEEAAHMALSKKASAACSTKVYENPSTCTTTSDQVENVCNNEPNSGSSELNFSESNEVPESELQNSNVIPTYFEDQLHSDEADILVNKTLKVFGYTTFRDGQKEAIVRVLNGFSTLLILSTGAGKSLCYQMPAYLYSKRNPGALTLCISPLVSLMEDQVQGVPSFLNAACLHNNMTTKNKESVIEKLQSKKLDVLLVSPEAICGGLFGLLKTGNLPPISFACIDEVHCVSQWSHNFRPSYLQICKILREKLNVKTILGLTATATAQTANSICEHLQIDPRTTIRGELIPRNLNLSVSRDKDKEEALLTLLRGERFKECDSVIIYCTRREECENIAKLIRINLQEAAINSTRTKVRQRISNNCEAYHAGMTPTRRRMVQKLFMNGEIRIVVATVAFGMGIDKSDIRAVVHFNMPKTFESYVQEIGRAGRDGLPAHCHLFLENVKGKDLCELKRHVYSNSVDRPTLRKLVSRVFKPCKCSRILALTGENKENHIKGNTGNRCPGHEVSFSVNDTVAELDLPEQNITTLLCYLELDDRKWIELLPLTYEQCKIQSYGGTKLLKLSAQNCPPLGVAIALKREKNKFKDNDTNLEFNVIETAATVGWNSAVVKRELKNLEWKATEFDNTGKGTKFRKSGILVEFSELAFRVTAPGDITDEEADEILNSLYKINLEQEKTQLYQLNKVYQALYSVSGPIVSECCDDFVSERSDRLKNFIHDYFQQLKLELPEKLDDPPLGNDKEEEVRNDSRNLIFSSQDTKFSGRSIAKIFQVVVLSFAVSFNYCFKRLKAINADALPKSDNPPRLNANGSTEDANSNTGSDLPLIS